MACCRSKRTRYPKAKLCGEPLTIVNCSEWMDNCNVDLRQAKWFFYKNGVPIYQTNFEFINTPIAIGYNSSIGQLNIPNGGQDLFAYLENLGFEFNENDILATRIQIINCHGFCSDFSNVLTFIKEAVIDDCPNPWLGINGEHFQTLAGDCWEVFLEDPNIAKKN